MSGRDAGGRTAGRTRRVVPALLVCGLVCGLVWGLLVAGCSGAGDGQTAAESGAGQAAVDRAGPDRVGAPPAADTGTRQQARRTRVQTRAVIRRGEVVLVAPDVDRARARVDEVLTRLGGHLAAEDTTNDRRGRPERSTLVLRVPEPAFDKAVRALADVGRTVRTDRSAEDVTTEVIDVETRVATHRASLDRLQRFLRRVTTVEDMVRLESEIAERQAQLESLEAQQSYLRDQTALATITVRMRAAGTPAPPVDRDAGFLPGLQAGWAALKAVLVGAATVAGAMLPFVVTIGLLGVPVWWLFRNARRRRTATPSAPEPDPT